MQRDLISTANNLNSAHLAAHPGYSDLQARIASYELAFQLQRTAPEALDLTKETEATKEMYGLNDPKTDHPLALEARSLWQAMPDRPTPRRTWCKVHPDLSWRRAPATELGCALWSLGKPNHPLSGD